MIINNSTHVRGLEYQQLFHHYPTLTSFYLPLEREYDVVPTLEFMKSTNYSIPIIATGLYLCLCFYGPHFMKDKPAYDLGQPLCYWNLFLSLFSFWGAIRTVPHIAFRIMNYSFERNVCEAPETAFGGGACGLAVQLFIISKIPELFDTLFIVLRKKDLIFLHWYHHVTVLLYCWNAYVTESAAGIWFVSMNYTVHAIMYFYYYMGVIKRVPKDFPAWIITGLQISQMIVGTTIVGASFYYYFAGGEIYKPGTCNNIPENLVAGGVIYGSYLYLFVEFAVKRYLSKSENKKGKEL